MTSTVKDSPTGWVKEHIDNYVTTGGADGHIWNGVPTLLLTTTGRKSGQRHRTALIYGQDGEDYVIVASKGGDPAHPAWYLNLTANPEVEVQVGDEVFSARAETVGDEDRERLWPAMAKIWPDYDNYAQKTDRTIPVVRLARV